MSFTTRSSSSCIWYVNKWKLLWGWLPWEKVWKEALSAVNHQFQKLWDEVAKAKSSAGSARMMDGCVLTACQWFHCHWCGEPVPGELSCESARAVAQPVTHGNTTRTCGQAWNKTGKLNLGLPHTEASAKDQMICKGKQHVPTCHPTCRFPWFGCWFRVSFTWFSKLNGGKCATCWEVGNFRV